MDKWTKYIQENNEVVEVLIASHYKVTRQIFYTVLELYIDQWNAKHITHFGFDNHAFLFFSAFRRATMRDEAYQLETQGD